MHALLLPLSARFIAYTTVVVLTAILLFADLEGYSSIYVVIPLILFGALALLGTIDLIQTRHAVLRNYPLTAHIRFILEEIRPEIRQYFLESEKDGTPFSRDKRAIVCQRASGLWTNARSARKTTFMPQATSGSTIRWRQSPWSRSRSASSSAGRIAASPIRLRSSIFRR
jgi:hypothetical protein